MALRDALILTNATLPTYGCNTAQIPAVREQRTSSLAEDELIELLARVDAVSRSASRVLHAHSPDRPTRSRPRFAAPGTGTARLYEFQIESASVSFYG
jgi:hypothetical protein